MPARNPAILLHGDNGHGPTAVDNLALGRRDVAQLPVQALVVVRGVRLTAIERRTRVAREPQHMMRAVTGTMRERTGRTLEEWSSWCRRRDRFLSTRMRCALAEGRARRGPEQPVGYRRCCRPRSGAAPILERLRAVAEAFGDDVSPEGRSTYTPFVRGRAAVKAATRTRVDLGLRFAEPPRSRLLAPGWGPGQATHKLSLTEDITAEVEKVLRAAYEQNP